MAYPTITPLPSAPSRNDPDNFSTEADTWVASFPALVTEVNAAGDYIEIKAGEAEQAVTDATAQVVLAADEVALAVIQAGNADDSAVAAAASAAAAVITANAGEWVSGASYAEGANAISFVDFGTYRAITTHTGVATDPSADATNWVLISADGIAYAPLAGAVTLTGGFDSTEQALGTITSGTVTPEVDAADEENYKVLTNNGAFTLAPPSTSSACGIRIHVINAASAGAITTTGFDKVFDPDGYATTNAKEYFFWIDHNSTRDLLTIREIV